ncbi:MAG: hypothetical protein Q7T11_05545 [Deltaproteobacteria bacterium]|nr:hypothetical protein [Deltaproteobacteria bacterium]
MVHLVSISEARKKLPSLLKAIANDPNLLFKIEVRKQPIAILSSARKSVRPGKAVSALLSLGGKKKSRKSGGASVTSENFKDFLYNPPTR